MSTDMKKPAPARGQANPNNSCHIKPNSQQALVLEALRQRPLSAAELQWMLPVADARAVVKALKGKGIPITTHKHPDPNRPGRRIQRYHLAELD